MIRCAKDWEDGKQNTGHVSSEKQSVNTQIQLTGQGKSSDKLDNRKE